MIFQQFSYSEKQATAQDSPPLEAVRPALRLDCRSGWASLRLGTWGIGVSKNLIPILAPLSLFSRHQFNEVLFRESQREYPAKYHQKSEGNCACRSGHTTPE